MLPQSSCLSTNVPESKVHSSELNLLDIQAHSWYGVLELIVLHLEEQSTLTCIVQTQEEHLLVIVLARTSCVLHLLQLTQIATHFINIIIIKLELTDQA